MEIIVALFEKRLYPKILIPGIKNEGILAVSS